MSLDLAQRLLAFRRSLNAQLELPRDRDNLGKAWEVISDHVYPDGTPVWTGLRYDFEIVKANGGPCFVSAGERRLAVLRKEIETARNTCNAMTHWKLATRDIGDGVPSLYRVARPKGKTYVSVERLKRWGCGNWSVVAGDVSAHMSSLHQKVLWKVFFANEFAESSVISLVYFFKVGYSVLGIWALHGCGEEVFGKLQDLSLDSDGVLKLVKPSILCLAESAKTKLDDLTVVHWDLALLAQNSLRISEDAMTLQDFKTNVTGGDDARTLEPTALALLRASPCDEHRGLDKYYDKVFDEVMASELRQGQAVLPALPAFSAILVPVEISSLKKLYVGWQLLTRACGIPSSVQDQWYAEGREMLRDWLEDSEQNALSKDIGRLWNLRSTRNKNCADDRRHLAELEDTLPVSFWDFVRTRVFGHEAADWAEYVANRCVSEGQEKTLTRLPKLFFLQQDS